MMLTARRSGGTGRRAAFRAQSSLRGCGFDSHLRHSKPGLLCLGFSFFCTLRRRQETDNQFVAASPRMWYV